MRSRTVSRPWSRCRLTLSTPPISRANASRRARSSSSGFQFILFLRLDRFPADLLGDLVTMRRCRQRLVVDTAGEDVAFGIVEHAGDGAAQFQKTRRDLLVQPRFVEHRS